MISLRNIQQQFAASLHVSEAADLTFISSNFPQERLEIYRHNVISNLMQALSITFPGVWKILGNQCADALAARFCQQESSWPSEGYLQEWGMGFADYLGEAVELASLEYIRDYACYEYYKYQSYCAQSVDVMEPDQFLESFNQGEGSYKISLIPSVYLYKSEHSLDSIEKCVVYEDIVQLERRAAYALIVRPQAQVKTFWLSYDVWYFLHEVIVHNDLIQAHKTTLDINPEFDLQDMLVFILQNHLVHKIVSR